MERHSRLMLWGVMWMVGVSLLVGCQGRRVTGIVEESTESGRVRPDGMVIRNYDISLAQAYDTVIAAAGDNRWLRIRYELEEYKAWVTVKTRDHVYIEFEMWGPRDEPTAIGVRYAEGDRPGAINVFEILERKLPGKRVKGNLARQPGDEDAPGGK